MDVLPLHLVVALDPPVAVVDLFLDHFVDASAKTVMSPAPWQNSKQFIFKRAFLNHKLLWQKIRRWKANRKGSFPVPAYDGESISKPNNSCEQEKEDLRTEQTDFVMRHVQHISGEIESVSHEPLVNGWGSTDEIDIDSNVDDANSTLSSIESSEPSRNAGNESAWKHTAVILQLSNSGGLTPLAVNTSGETESTFADSEKSDLLWIVDWDMRPLLQEISILPLHIACIYEASSEVVDRLLGAYPPGVICRALGMLPIHFVAAGWRSPILSDRPEESMVVPLDNKPGPLPTLQVLRRAAPESTKTRSGNHGMTAEEYIEECMEEGDYKEKCRMAITGVETGSIEDTASKSERLHVGLPATSSTDSVFFVDSDDSSLPSLVPYKRAVVDGLSGVIANQEWEQALEMVEDDPSTANRWYYGVENDGAKTLIWKRLAIHLACIGGAPLGLIELLLNSFPEGATQEDNSDGSLPLHMVCKTKVQLDVVKVVYTFYPEATQAVDVYGRCALHMAVIHRSPIDVVRYLVQMDPESAVLSDQSGQSPVDYAMEMDDEELVHLMTKILVLLEKNSTYE